MMLFYSKQDDFRWLVPGTRIVTKTRLLSVQTVLTPGCVGYPVFMWDPTSIRGFTINQDM